MPIAHHQKDVGDLHIRDLQMTPKRSFKVKGQDALLLIGQWRTFLFLPGPRNNGLDDTGHFRCRNLEMTSSRSSKVKFVADSEGPISTFQ